MDFWKETLGAPRKIVAPMVDASELPWRLLSRRYGADLCYTPMLHSTIFSKDPKYRNEALASTPEDKPLIVQFCGNDPEVILEAALLAQDHFSAIDINLGCPQAIAKRGHYGAYLQDEWDLLQEIVSLLVANLKIPVTCKIRRFESVEKTVRYAKMLEAAGCKMLTVHGRTRDQHGPLTGLADWSYVKAVRESVSIPVISNGNIQCMEDVDRCMAETGALGVMTAEGNLYNPAFFSRQYLPCWVLALEYLDLVDRYPCPVSYVRGHLFKLCHNVLTIPKNNPLRIELGGANTMTEFRKIMNVIKDTYESYNEGYSLWEDSVEPDSENLSLPPWLCQPYVRMCPEEHLKKVEENTNKSAEPKRRYEDAEGNAISRRQMKKLRRASKKPRKNNYTITERSLYNCSNCANPLGGKCGFKLCKQCCKSKCYVENLDCPGHRILVKTRRGIAQFHAKLRENNDSIEAMVAT